MKRFWGILFLCILAMGQPVGAKADPEIQATLRQLEKFSEAFAAIAADVTPAVVAIVNKRNVLVGVRGPFNDPFLDQFFGIPHQYRREQRQQSMGSGVIVSNDGYILTNNHVIAGADEILVDLADGRSFEAHVVGTDPQSDVAVLKIAGKDLPVVSMGNSDALKVGAWVLAIGNPFGLRHTVTSGIVSAIGRGNLQLLDYEDFIQTDAAINPGNSGGAMVNMRGELIGINTAIFSRSGGNQGIGFAVPINMARSIMEQIIAHGGVTRGYLDVAVQDLSPGLVQALGLTSRQGALVQEVADDAEKAGLQQGDVIVAINGRAISNAEEFRTRIAQTRPGSTVDIDVMRKGQRQTIRVPLIGLNDRMARANLVTRREAALGIEVQELTPALARRLGYEVQTGVIITNVRAGSPASQGRYRLQAGDVIMVINDQPIGSLDDYLNSLASLKEGHEVWLRIRREYQRHYRTFDIGLRLPK